MHGQADEDSGWCFYPSDQLQQLADRVDHFRHYRSENGLADLLNVEPKAVA
jgi:hypothetical protein